VHHLTSDVSSECLAAKDARETSNGKTK